MAIGSDLSARIVIDTSGIGGKGGVGGGDPDNKIKSVTGLLRRMLRLQLVSTDALVAQLFGGKIGSKVLGAAGAGTAIAAGGALTIGAATAGLAVGVGEGLAAGDGQDILPTTSEEAYEGVLDALDITREQAEDQAGSQQTITSDTRSIEEKIADNLATVNLQNIENNNILSGQKSVSKAYRDWAAAVRAQKRKVRASNENYVEELDKDESGGIADDVEIPVSDVVRDLFGGNFKRIEINSPVQITPP